MKSLFSPNIIEIPLDDNDLKYSGSLPLKQKKKYKIKVIPNFDFLIIEINGNMTKIDVDNSERLEQELLKGKTVEMEFSIGSGGDIRIICTWQGESLAGGSKAMTMKIINQMRVETKKAKPTQEGLNEIQKIFYKIQSNLLPFVCIQDIEIVRGQVRLQKVRNWYV